MASRGSRKTRPIPRITEGLRLLRTPLPSCPSDPLAGLFPARKPQGAIGFTESLRQKHDRFRVRLSAVSSLSLCSHGSGEQPTPHHFGSGAVPHFAASSACCKSRPFRRFTYVTRVDQPSPGPVDAGGSTPSLTDRISLERAGTLLPELRTKALPPMPVQLGYS